jgi:protein-disulfide isomerase
MVFFISVSLLVDHDSILNAQLQSGYNARMDTITPVEKLNDQVSNESGQNPIRQARPKRLKPKFYTWSELLALPLVFFLGLGLGWLIWGQAAPSQVAEDVGNGAGEIRRFEVSVDDDPALGPANAPVTIVEFSDYQCPFCARWHTEVFTRLMTDYQGKVRFVYRDFPLYSIHPQAGPAAEAANCAGEQNAYWEFHTALFSEKYALGADAYTRYAAELGLDAEKFSQCLSERRYQGEVEADFASASKLGVNSTPTFYINGRGLIGAQPYEAFKQVIDEELAAVKK